MNFLSTQEIAATTGVQIRTAQIWAGKNNVRCIGSGRGKIYLWTEADLERFKQREKPGRRWHKD